jgi:hypothetical protein
LLVGRRTESPGFTDGRAGSNVSMFAIGVVEREATGVTSWEFALGKEKNGLITIEPRNKDT